MYRNVSLKMDKIFPKYYITYFGLCKLFNNGYLFSYDAVFLGHPVYFRDFPYMKIFDAYLHNMMKWESCNTVKSVHYIPVYLKFQVHES